MLWAHQKEGLPQEETAEVDYGNIMAQSMRNISNVLLIFREFIQVIQRNFRKYKVHRDWPWFVIIQKTKPLIGMVNVEEELRLLEEKANSAFGAYQEQLNTKAKLEEENTDLAAEIKGIRDKINSEQGDLGAYQERQAKISAQKADLEVELEENNKKLELEER